MVIRLQIYAKKEKKEWKTVKCKEGILMARIPSFNYKNNNFSL